MRTSSTPSTNKTSFDHRKSRVGHSVHAAIGEGTDEALEAVDRDLAKVNDPLELTRLHEQTVPTQSCDVMGHRGRAAPKGSRHLPVPHASHDHHRHSIREVGTLLPVGRREGLTTEVTLAGPASKPLDTLRGALAGIEALARVRPARGQGVEV
jgi:hypothetical protein